MFTSVSYMLGKEGEGGKTIYFVAFIPMRTRGSRTTSSAGHTESVYETSLHALEVSLALSGFFPLLQIIVISKPNLFKLGKDTSPQVCQLQTRAQNVLCIFFQLLEYASVTTMVLWQTLFSCCREC